jgi:hypothetical protein
MKLVAKIFAGVVALGLLWWAVEMIAAESGEVVVLTTTDAEGGGHETRLWIVEHAGADWLRAGADISGWYQRLLARPEITVERDEQASPYRAVPDPTQRDAINRLFLDKYGWAEGYIGFFFDRDNAIPIRLEPRAG